MREGTKVQNKNSDEIGIIKSIIGNVAIVMYGDTAKKELLSNLIDAEKSVTQTEFIAAHQEMLSDGSIQSFFEDKLDEEEMDYNRTILLAFGVELCHKLFEQNEG